MRERFTIRLGADERRRLERVGDRLGLAPGTILRAGGLRLAEELEGRRPGPLEVAEGEENQVARGKPAAEP